MKKGKMKPAAFVLTLALVVSCFLPYGTVYAASISETSSGAGTIDTSAQSNVKLSDISGHWGESDIENAVKSGFVKGYEDGTFKPDKAVTRAEFVTMVNKALQLRDENTVKLLFQDVKETAWYYKDIQKAGYAKYVSGITDTSFMPNKNITREEAAAMLARFLPKDGYQTEAVPGTYADKSQVSSWAKDAMAVVINKGYLTGYANGNLAPKATLTRAEAAKIIGKILDKETIVREDVSVKNTGEILKGKIYVGDITIEKSVGEGEASLENLSALSRLYVKGGGTHTVTIHNSTVIQLVVCKEGTTVRVLSEDGSTIYEAFVFNGNLLVNSQGQSAVTGENGYENIIYLNGTVTADTAIKIADAIANRIDNTGAITQEQVSEGVAAVVTGSTATVNDDGSIAVTVSSTAETSGSSGGHNSGGSGDSNGGGLTVNGLPATLSDITGTACSCGLPLASAGAFTKEIEFDPDGVSGGPTVTGYAIYTEAQLQHLAIHLNANAVLMNDLDFTGIAIGSGNPSTPMGALKVASAAGLYITGHAISDFETGNFVPIGDYTTEPYPYTGTFCGNGKSISGLIASGSGIDYVGLFGYTSGAAIKDLTISGGTFSGIYCVGSVAGESDFGTVVSGIHNTGTVTGKEGIGGVVGVNDPDTIVNDCHNTGAVTGISNYVGGVVGYNYKGSKISNSSNTGTVTGTGYIGGVVGMNGVTTESDPDTIVNACYNTGAVTGTGDNGNVGGVAGDNAGAVNGSHNTGTVDGLDNVGGVAGYNEGTISSSNNTGDVTSTYSYGDVGGVAGYNNGTVSGSNNTGAVTDTGTETGNGYVGGVVGISFGPVSACYNTGKVTGPNYTGGVAGSNCGTVSGSYNTGTVISTNSNIGYVGGVVGRNDGPVDTCYNTGAVTSTGTGSSDYIGGIAGYNCSGTVDGSYNTGAVTGIGISEYVGGVAGRNDGPISSCYNTGAVTGTANNAFIGGVAGVNNLTITGSYWLEGTNLIGANGDASGISPFSAIGPTITAIYTSMSAITTSAGGEIDAITNIEFLGIGIYPTTFNTMQSSYILSGISLTFAVNAAPGTAVTVTTGAALGTLITPGGITVTPQSSDGNTYTYSLAGLTSGTWILVEAVNSQDPKLNRVYTIYIK